ncbi:hypothetical protein [Staphylococcus sp. GDY8P83P]|uniref:hypothetical protein n=1 Tax=Staphylococcus sp. GDY8P83P TaxID=2804137 RepID=UPI001AEC67D3|nr:hypothetical protein [Staphylococcus sp. GDY8P83P]
MDYRHKIAIESCVKKIHEQQGTIEKAQEMNDELEKTYDKAKAFDEVKNFVTKRLKEEKTTDEYDYGERFVCEEIKRMLEDE